MKRLALSFVLGTVLACSPAAPPTTPDAGALPSATPPVAPSAAKRPGKDVTFPSSAGTAMGYLVEPAAGSAKHPALVVIQEWWGLNDWMRDNAERFAKKGYVVLAIDLYRGHATKSPDEAHELMRGLPEDRALADMKAAVDYLVARPDVDAARVGSVGWCMGGGYSLTLAVSEPRLRAAVINYGRLVTDPAAISGVKASLLGNFAGEDRGIPVADVRAFEGAMKGAGKNVDIKVYDGAGHAFMNPNNEKGFDAKAAEDAWARIDTFFGKELGAP